MAAAVAAVVVAAAAAAIVCCCLGALEAPDPGLGHRRRRGGASLLPLRAGPGGRSHRRVLEVGATSSRAIANC